MYIRKHDTVGYRGCDKNVKTSLSCLPVDKRERQRGVRRLRERTAAPVREESQWEIQRAARDER